MSRLARKRIAILLLCLSISGCAHQHLRGSSPNSPHGGFAVSPVARIERTGAALDPSAVAVHPQAAPDRSLQFEEVWYDRPLRAEDVQCMAAAHAPIANLSDLERQLAVCHQPLASKHRRPLAIQREVLGLRAVQERNQAAGTALELFYRLAEAEAGLDLLQSSLEQLGRTIGQIAELRARGFPVDVDEAALRHREFELRQEQAELELAVTRLNRQLQLLLGGDPLDRQPIRPLVDWDDFAEPSDIESEVYVGLAQRADLAILRRLLQTLEAPTLPLARAVLEQQGVGTITRPHGLAGLLHQLLPGHANWELSRRRHQLASLLAEGEQMAAEEIATAASTVSTRLRQIRLAQEALENRQRRLDELRRRREIATVTAFEVSAARLERIEAEGELMQRIIAWKIADVQLKEAQGLLARQCGFVY
jgi:hypothetical protein